MSVNSTTDGYPVLVSYLTSHGWSTEFVGDSSSIWAKDSTRGRQELGVPTRVSMGSFEWNDILRRMAYADSLTTTSIAAELEFATFDGVRFRIANDGFIGRTVPLHSGLTLVSSAFSMLRASATTAQRPRGQIGTGWSKTGDDYVERARLAHTEEGSYVVPILFQHDEAVVPRNIEPVAGTEALTRESPQRRIVRTFAETMAIYKRRIIEPAKEPSQGDLTSVIAAGGSRELFNSLEKVLADPSVAQFETRVSWGLALPAPGGVTSSVAIPSEAHDIVKKTVELLTVPQKQPQRIVTGPIFSISHEPGTPLGEISIQAPSHNGRPSRYYVTVRQEQLGELHVWMDASTTVTVQGIVEHLPGRPLRLEGVLAPIRLDDVFVNNDSDGS